MGPSVGATQFGVIEGVGVIVGVIVGVCVGVGVSVCVGVELREVPGEGVGDCEIPGVGVLVGV